VRPPAATRRNPDATKGVAVDCLNQAASGPQWVTVVPQGVGRNSRPHAKSVSLATQPNSDNSHPDAIFGLFRPIRLT